jgi:hypothetical protein
MPATAVVASALATPVVVTGEFLESDRRGGVAVRFDHLVLVGQEGGDGGDFVPCQQEGGGGEVFVEELDARGAGDRKVFARRENLRTTGLPRRPRATIRPRRQLHHTAISDRFAEGLRIVLRLLGCALVRFRARCAFFVSGHLIAPARGTRFASAPSTGRE